MRIRKQALGDRNIVGAKIEQKRKSMGMKQKDLLTQLQIKGIDLNAPATREVVAELLFQSINVPMVTYTAAFGYQNVSLTADKDKNLLKNNATLGYKNFGLICGEDEDKWGRPTKVWANDVNESGKYEYNKDSAYALQG